jgi:chromosome segregation ATPase
MKPSRIILVAAFAGLLWSCDTKEKQQLISKVDSLQIELQASQETAATLQEIGVLLDEIDATRQVLRTNVVEGTSYADYKGRMTELNDYIRQTQDKIAELENSMKKSSANYSATIKRLKADLELNKQQIAALQEEVDKMRTDNEMLVQTVSLKEQDISRQNEVIQLKEQAVADLEAQVQKVNTDSRVSQADLFFAQAQALETAADRTKFAPKKKKETQREALELYRQSFSLGKQEAESRIAELEKELG